MGAQRGGTNSLYEYLVRHPNVGRALPIQEVHFFDINYDRGPAWYRSHFPTKARAEVTMRRTGLPLITGESSPYYMFHPHASTRIASVLPEAKLLVLLRNPIDRAYSHFKHELQRGIESLSFEEAVDREPERLDGEDERMRRDPNYYSFNHHHFTYCARGLYANQIERLYSLFPKQNILVEISEQFFSEPEAAYSRVLTFLGLSRHSLSDYPRFNPGVRSDLDPQLRRRLANYFSTANDQLSKLLGISLPWD